VDRTPILAGIDDSNHRAQELSEVRGSPDFLQNPGMLELGFKRHRIRELPCLDPSGNRPVDAPMHGIGKVLGRQEFADPLIGLVVRKERA
jgi:hypothetical protein